MRGESVNRALRTLMQSGVLNTLVVLLRVFGVPITSEQQEAILAASAALALVVLAWNGVEDLTGKAVLKDQKDT